MGGSYPGLRGAINYFGYFGVFVSIGNVALATSMIPAVAPCAVGAGTSLSVAILLGISSFLISAHPPLYGPIGLVSFIVAAARFLLSQSTPIPSVGCSGKRVPVSGTLAQTTSSFGASTGSA